MSRLVSINKKIEHLSLQSNTEGRQQFTAKTSQYNTTIVYRYECIWSPKSWNAPFLWCLRCEANNTYKKSNLPRKKLPVHQPVCCYPELGQHPWESPAVQVHQVPRQDGNQSAAGRETFRLWRKPSLPVLRLLESRMRPTQWPLLALQCNPWLYSSDMITITAN